MPAPIVIRNLTPETKKAANPEPGEPLIATKADLRDGSRASSGSEPGPSDGSLIFDAGFDNIPDWEITWANQRVFYPGYNDSDDPASNLPGNFDSMYTTERWHENRVDNNDPVSGAEPIGQINSRVLSPSGGKTLLVYDESYGGPSQWGSECQLGKDLPGVYQELWVEFYLRFDANYQWQDVESGGGTSTQKMFRLRYVPDNYATETRYDFFGDGGRAKAPVYMMDLKSWTTTDFSVARIKPFIRGFTPQDLIGVDENYYLTDYEDEVSISQGGASSLSMAQVMNGQWVKFGIYVKMDSSPGAGDGIEEVWVNDILEKRRADIPFRRTGEGLEAGFNWVSIGGNAYNTPVDETLQFEQPYAIADFKVFNGKPEGQA